MKQTYLFHALGTSRKLSHKAKSIYEEIWDLIQKTNEKQLTTDNFSQTIEYNHIETHTIVYISISRSTLETPLEFQNKP